jgi:hypothetical protein
MVNSLALNAQVLKMAQLLQDIKHTLTRIENISYLYAVLERPANNQIYALTHFLVCLCYVLHY